MLPSSPRPRPLGTMIAYGFPRGDVGIDLGLAARLGATCLEILPDWRQFPDTRELRRRVADGGGIVHSVHGCWGGQSISANRVDLGDPEPRGRQAGMDDVKRSIEWTAAVGGGVLVVHPGGVSDPERIVERRAALAASLLALADHARGSGVTICVENMPPGVHPGSRMADLTALVAELDLPELALALDTGHANITASAAAEALAAGRWLRTTHVHDNNGRQDTHLPPGSGTVDWDAWLAALDRVEYAGPIMLECIRYLRENLESFSPDLFALLDRLTAGGRGGD